MKKLSALFLICFGFSTLCFGQEKIPLNTKPLRVPVQESEGLIVVEDLGGKPALPYYETINADPQTSAIKDMAPIQRSITEADMLPVVSNKLSPGKVEGKPINASGLVVPIFLVGADELSSAWLKQRASKLKELGAVGMAVNVPDMSALQAIRAIAPDLTIIPASGDDFNAHLGVTTYPVLITRTAMDQ
jgi:integrating conjugative element protein, PFL_4695 family